MSIPTTLFIDTSVFDSQHYNFNSSAFAAFTAVAKDLELTLLLPDPIEREIRRHIEEKADEAQQALEDARRKASFLGQWKGWPLKGKQTSIATELREFVREKWSDFLGTFCVKKLEYSGVKLSEIMDWYDYGKAPFGAGKKRKEFPDAFAVAAVAAHAKTENTSVAVISHDNDLKAACARYSELLYFPDLPSITEALLANDSRLATVKSLLASQPEVLLQAIGKEFPDRGFYLEEIVEGEVEDIEVYEVAVTEQHVVGIGSSECSVAFTAEVSFSAYAKYDDPDTAIVDSSEGIFIPLHTYAGTVQDRTEITGVAKMIFNAKMDSLESVALLSIDQDEIPLTETPDEKYEDWLDDNEQSNDE